MRTPLEVACQTCGSPAGITCNRIGTTYNPVGPHAQRRHDAHHAAADTGPDVIDLRSWLADKIAARVRAAAINNVLTPDPGTHWHRRT